MKTKATIAGPRALAGSPFVSLTTFRRDGTAVATPVWCAGDDRYLLVFTEANSGKVKRLHHDPHVRVAPSSARGKPHGPDVDGEASIDEDTTEVKALLAQKYGWMWSGYNSLMALARRVRRQPMPRAVTVRITFH